MLAGRAVLSTNSPPEFLLQDVLSIFLKFSLVNNLSQLGNTDVILLHCSVEATHEKLHAVMPFPKMSS